MPDQRKVKWGVLSTAKIALQKVIPSMQKSQYCEIIGISSRKIESAKAAAKALNIPKAYGSYEELLSDPEIEAVYNPLPNHLHVPFTIKALEAGKHVLCEKPIAVSTHEVEQLIEVSENFPHLKVMEAFMYRFHPQWIKVSEIIKSGEIGEIRSIDSVFTYYNVDPINVRNKEIVGGGGVLDIGCYCINLSRFLFEDEPIQVLSFVDYDPVFRIDRFASAMLKFKQGVATLMCSTQLAHRQAATIFGTKGYIELNIPFNAANEVPRKIHLHKTGKTETIFFDICDQYTLQADAFCKAILDDTQVPISLEDALANMRVIDQILAPKLS